MANTNLTRSISVFVFCMICTAGFCQTTYYVDPAFAGGTRTGSASAPWQSLSDSGAWSAINSALASGNVTVYFSATGSSTTPIGLGSRTDASTHVLTLDGISMKDTNSSSPSWTTSVAPTPCKYDAPGCAWVSAPKFTITASTPIAGSDSATNCKNYFTIQGFTIHNTEGQSADLTYTGNLTFQYNDVSRVATGSYGPGIIAGPGNKGPGCGGAGPSNVTLQYNHIHSTWGECIYIGATTPDPPGGPSSSEYTSNGLSCGTACSTGANYMIRGNVIESCASWGGQGDGTDIKDGHANLQIIDNTYRPSKACTSCGSQTPGNDGQGIVMESGALVDGNYIEAPGHEGIAIMDSWNNSVGRQDGLVVRNNIIVNVNSGVGHNNGIEAQPQQSGDTQTWNSLAVYNNTIYSTANACITVSSALATGANIDNNICDSTGGGVTGSPIASKDYQDYYNAGVSCPVSGEANSVCTNPDFVSTAAPYVDTNFKLQSASPAGADGMDLSSLFTDDYFGDTRATPWSMSAAAENVSATQGPAPPSALVATVN
jgi:hypothetical protein